MSVFFIALSPHVLLTSQSFSLSLSYSSLTTVLFFVVLKCPKISFVSTGTLLPHWMWTQMCCSCSTLGPCLCDQYRHLFSLAQQHLISLYFLLIFRSTRLVSFLSSILPFLALLRVSKFMSCLMLFWQETTAHFFQYQLYNDHVLLFLPYLIVGLQTTLSFHKTIAKYFLAVVSCTRSCIRLHVSVLLLSSTNVFLKDTFNWFQSFTSSCFALSQTFAAPTKWLQAVWYVNAEGQLCKAAEFSSLLLLRFGITLKFLVSSTLELLSP